MLWRSLLTLVAIVGTSLAVLAGALSSLNGKSWLELPSWLSGTTGAETQPAESDALNTPEARMSSLQQQADILRIDLQKEVAERKQELQQVNGLQQQTSVLQKDLQEEVTERKQELQQMNGLQQQTSVLQKDLQEEVTERKQELHQVGDRQQQELQRMGDLQLEADALQIDLQEEVAERKQELHQMVRRPRQHSSRRGAGHHQQPNRAHWRAERSNGTDDGRDGKLIVGSPATHKLEEARQAGKAVLRRVDAGGNPLAAKAAARVQHQHQRRPDGSPPPAPGHRGERG